MIYQCTGCNHTKDDDNDIGTLIGEDYYCEGCLAEKEAKDKAQNYVNKVFINYADKAWRNP